MWNSYAGAPLASDLKGKARQWLTVDETKIRSRLSSLEYGCARICPVLDATGVS